LLHIWGKWSQTERMKYREAVREALSRHISAIQRSVTQSKAGDSSPRGRRPFLVLWGLLAVSLLSEVVAIALLMHLVDLSLSLMELWAELARKHLEIVLSDP